LVNLNDKFEIENDPQEIIIDLRKVESWICLLLKR